MSPFRLAYLHLVRRRGSTLIALVSIAVAVGFSGMFLRSSHLATDRFASLVRDGDVLVGAKSGGLESLLGCLNLEGPYPEFIPSQLYETFRARRTVVFADSALRPGASVTAVVPFLHAALYRGHRVIGTDGTFLERRDVRLAEGSWAETRNTVVAGSEAARGLRPGNVLLVQPWIQEGRVERTSVSLTVSGVLQPTGTAWDRALFTNLETAQGILQPFGHRLPEAWKSNVLHYMLVDVPPGFMEDFMKMVNTRTVAHATSVVAQRTRLEELTATGGRFGLLIGSLIVLLGGLAVASMMTARFDALTVQLAMLRAMGYQKREIAGWLLWEGLLLGSAACCIGVILDGAMFPLLLAAMAPVLPEGGTAIPLIRSFPVWIAVLCASVLTVLLPMMRALRQDVHDALKGS